MFLDGLTAFDVYYKVLNIGIDVLGTKIVNNWYEDYYPSQLLETNVHNIDTYHFNHRLLYAIGILTILGNMMFVFLVSLYDGCNVNRGIKFSLALLFAGFYVHKIGILYFTNATTADHVVHFWNYDIDWRVASISSIFATLLFIFKQYFQIIFRNRMTLVTCFINIDMVHNGNSMYENSKNEKQLSRGRAIRVELNQRLLGENETHVTGGDDMYINTNDHAYDKSNINAVLKGSNNSKNMNLGKSDGTLQSISAEVQQQQARAEKSTLTFTVSENVRASSLIQEQCNKFDIQIASEVTLFYVVFHMLLRFNEYKSIELCRKFGTPWLLWTCFVFIIFHIFFEILSNSYFYFVEIKLIETFFYFLSVLIIFLNINYQVFIYQIRLFLVWYIFFDACVIVGGLMLIHSKYHEYDWNITLVVSILFRKNKEQQCQWHKIDISILTIYVNIFII